MIRGVKRNPYDWQVCEEVFEELLPHQWSHETEGRGWYSPLSNVLDHQVAAYVKGDFLPHFLYILMIFEWQIHEDDLCKLNIRWYHVKEQPKVDPKWAFQSVTV